MYIVVGRAAASNGFKRLDLIVNVVAGPSENFFPDRDCSMLAARDSYLRYVKSILPM